MHLFFIGVGLATWWSLPRRSKCDMYLFKPAVSFQNYDLITINTLTEQGSINAKALIIDKVKK
jgi:hypothetical protein